jgi:dihydroxy-acid dehydratase
MEGGPIAAIRNGDRIRIDIPKRSIDLLVSGEEMKRRLSLWKPPKPKITKGYLSRYSRMVSSAGKGAIME